MRCSEALNIKYKDYDFKTKELTVLGKNDVMRLIPLNESVSNIFESYINNNDYLNSDSFIFLNNNKYISILHSLFNVLFTSELKFKLLIVIPILLVCIAKKNKNKIIKIKRKNNINHILS